MMRNQFTHALLIGIMAGGKSPEEIREEMAERKRLEAEQKRIRTQEAEARKEQEKIQKEGKNPKHSNPTTDVHHHSSGMTKRR